MDAIDLSAVFTKQFFLFAFLIVFTVVYVFAAKRFLSSSQDRRRRRQEALYTAISQGFLKATVDAVEDLVNLYKGVHKLGADDISYRAGLSRTLREYLVDIVSSSSLDVAETKRLKDKATAILKEIEAQAPYADLPVAERNLLVDVERFVRAGDNISAAMKLQDLAGLIEVRSEEFERLQAANKWSVPLAVIGLVLTVVFGTISLIK